MLRYYFLKATKSCNNKQYKYTIETGQIRITIPIYKSVRTTKMICIKNRQTFGQINKPKFLSGYNFKK